MPTTIAPASADRPAPLGQDEVVLEVRGSHGLFGAEPGHAGEFGEQCCVLDKFAITLGCRSGSVP
jgi:hypothetical protein